MLRPVIFIGCGGSGEKAVRYIRDAVNRRLDQSDWNLGMPESWQFIGLDTLTTQENPTEIPVIPNRDFITLALEHDTYAALHRSLQADHNFNQGRPDLLCGWLPRPEEVRIPIKDGAGQNRAMGRAMGLRSLERSLLPRLRDAFGRAKAGAQELYEVGKALGVDAALGSASPEPLVMVCTSMAGGTGAGIALDVVDLLRRCDPLGKYPTLVLFSNDIFDFQDKKSAMAANSLGVISEMLAAYWSVPGEIESPLSALQVQDPGVGPHSVFVLSKAGYSGADLGKTTEFYQAVGEALSSWVTSNTVQERIHNFINVNWLNSAKENFGGYPFGRERQFGAVSSFGAAKVTVGRERFAQWARHLLVRDVLQRLLNGHMRLEQASGPTRRDEEIVAEQGKKYAEMAYRGVPNWLLPAPDQVPGLRGAEQHYASNEALREQAAQIKNSLEAELTQGQSATGAQWKGQLERLGKRQRDEIDRRNQRHLQEDVDWCHDMVDATCSAVSQIAAVASLPVATAAIEEATLLNRAELTRIRAQAKSAEQAYLDRVNKALSNISRVDGEISNDDPKLADAIKELSRGLAQHWQSLRLEHAAEMLRQAESQVLAKVADTVRAAAGQVGDALASDEVKAWPTSIRSVPPRYLPSTVEFPLEEYSTWSENLADLCKQATEPGVPYGSEPTDPLRYRLVAGTDLMEGEEKIRPLVLQESNRWIPGQVANLFCQADAEGIMGSVQLWTGDSAGKFKRFLDEGLGGYLASDDPHTGRTRTDHSQRLQKFRRQLGEAKNRSEPLVSLDNDLYGQCHDKPVTMLMVCSQFPFPDGHPAHQDAKEIVGEEAFVPGNLDTTSVLVSQYLESPVHPLVVRSVTNPLSEALSSATAADERSSSFWLWRRARRLDAFVPLPVPVVEAIIRGFAVARLCGYISVDPYRPIEISAGDEIVQFPWPLLSRPDGENDVLPSLLESFSLTYGMVGGAGFSVYESYKRLYELGEPHGHGRIGDDLKALLDSGVPPQQVLSGEEPKARGETYEERLEAAQTYLRRNEEMFLKEQRRRGTGEFFHKGADGRSERGVPTMELADALIKCYQEVLDSLKGNGDAGSVV